MYILVVRPVGRYYPKVHIDEPDTLSFPRDIPFRIF